MTYDGIAEYKVTFPTLGRKHWQSAAIRALLWVQSPPAEAAPEVAPPDAGLRSCGGYRRDPQEHLMAKATSKLSSKLKPSVAGSVKRSAAQQASNRTSRARSASRSPSSAAKPDTKHARIIAMLRTPAGTTIAAIMTATHWQQHSVRGFLAGVVRKKLSLNLISEQTDKGRVYRIKDGKASAVTIDRVKKAA